MVMGEKLNSMIINGKDSVAVAFRKIKAGDSLDAGINIKVEENIPMAHKIAVKQIEKGEEVLKYGQSIGIATEKILPGSWVHTHNLIPSKETDSFEYNPKLRDFSPKQTEKLFFNGYNRENGQAGIRNYIFVIPTVFCANGPAKKIAEMATAKHGTKENFDGFLPLTHGYGCGQDGGDVKNLQLILSKLANNPNTAGALILSLGCEINSLDVFLPYLGDFDPNRIKILKLQDVEDEFEDGLKLSGELYNYATKYKREAIPVSKLVLALNCGGSDGLSGITANPILGDVCDIIVSQGGSVIMTEVAEMFGAEKMLMDRAKDENVFNKIVDMIQYYKDYFAKHNVDFSGDVTQGNSAGGLTTLPEKSLGCTQKAGSAFVSDVIQYGERLTVPGLNLLNGPAHDSIGITAEIAAGANMVVFTTGRGTPGGFAAPTLRMSTNSELFNKKKHWNDFNAGSLLEGKSKEALTTELFDLIIQVASGEVKTKSEINDYFEIGILRHGVTF
jgi:altronate hydrolase